MRQTSIPHHSGVKRYPWICWPSVMAPVISDWKTCVTGRLSGLICHPFRAMPRHLQCVAVHVGRRQERAICPMVPIPEGARVAMQECTLRIRIRTRSRTYVRTKHLKPNTQGHLLLYTSLLIFTCTSLDDPFLAPHATFAQYSSRYSPMKTKTYSCWDLLNHLEPW